MGRQYLYSEVTCSQKCKTNKKGVTFVSNKAKRFYNIKEADQFRGHPWFSVLDYWNEEIEKFSAIEEVEETPKVEEPELEPELEPEPEPEPELKPEEEPEKEFEKVVKKKTLKKTLKKKMKKSGGE